MTTWHITAVQLRHPDTAVIECRAGVSGPVAAVADDLTLEVLSAEGDVAAEIVCTPVAGQAADGVCFQAVLPATPFRGLRFRAPAGTVLVVPPELAASLENLLPETDEDYDRNFLQKPRRYGDGRSQFFLADRVCRHFPGNPAFKVTSAVVAGYKAAESGLDQEAQVAAMHLEDALVLTTTLPVHKHPRRNPEHLRLSLLTALWHLHLAAGNREACLHALERTHEMSLGLRYYATPAYPACRSLLLLGWIHYRLGNAARAGFYWQRATELYALAVRDSSFSSAIVFEELRDVVSSSVMAAQGLGMIAGQAPPDLHLDTQSVLQRASRISGAPLERMQSSLFAWLDGPVVTATEVSPGAVAEAQPVSVAGGGEQPADDRVAVTGSGPTQQPSPGLWSKLRRFLSGGNARVPAGATGTPAESTAALPEETGRLANEALGFYLANAIGRVTDAHQRACAEAAARPQALAKVLAQRNATLHVLSSSKLKSAGLAPASHARLSALVETCCSPRFGLDLVAGAVAGRVAIASPFGSGTATCQESIPLDGSVNCLRFVDGEQTFHVFQVVSSADAIYLPGENLLISMNSIAESHVALLQAAIIGNLSALLRYASAGNRFAGVIASHSRPYHFFYDIWPSLLELHGQADLAGKIPAVVMRRSHDFVPPSALPGFPVVSVMEPRDIFDASVGAGGFFLHLGVLKRLRRNADYISGDDHLVQLATTLPGKQAAQVQKTLANCYPVVWVGVEGQKRAWLEQAEGLAVILNELAGRFPRLGVILDGWTMPFTPTRSLARQADLDRAVAKKITRSLPSRVRHASVIGATPLTKLAVGQRADFFISNLSTGSMYVSRMLGKPGFCHISNASSAIMLRQSMHVHPNRAVFLLPAGFVQDQPGEDADTRHDRISYSIAPGDFRDFIAQRLDLVLDRSGVPARRYFVEAPFAVNPALRQHVRIAAFGNVLVVPGRGETFHAWRDVEGLPGNYLDSVIVTGEFSAACLESVPGSAGMTWLRNPVRRCMQHALALAQAVGATPAEVLRASHAELDNTLTRWLSGVDAPFGECTPDMLARATYNLADRFTFVGIEERSRESLDLLCAQERWDRTLFPLALPAAVEADDRLFSAEDMALIRQRVALDNSLYEEAVRLFEARLQRLHATATAGS